MKTVINHSHYMKVQKTQRIYKYKTKHETSQQPQVRSPICRYSSEHSSSSTTIFRKTILFQI